MNSPLQEMKMWPREVNPLRLRGWQGKGEETQRCNPVLKLNASESFVWVIVGGIS